MRSRRRGPVLLALAVGMVWVLSAEAAAGEPVTLRIRAAELDPSGAVRLLVSVGGAAADRVLGPDNFRVTEEGRDVGDLAVDPLITSQIQPVAVVLLLDTSGSTKGKPLADAKAGAKGFIGGLPDGVSVAILSFAATAEVRSEFTTDRGALYAAIDALDAGGETALYDAIGLAASLLNRMPEHQHNLVVFSDGGDTVSQTSLDQAVAAARETQALVTSVALVTPEFDRRPLDRLASDTEGATISVEASASLSEAFIRVAKEIASQYVLTYRAEALEPADLDIEATLIFNGTRASDAVVALNPRVAPPDPIPDLPPVVVRNPLPVLAQVGLWTGLGAAFLALLFLGMAVFTPLLRTGRGLLASGLSTQARERRERSELTLVSSTLARGAVRFVDQLPKPKGFEERLAVLLERASWPLRGSEFLVLQGLGAVAGMLVGLGVFGRPWAGLVLMVAGGMAPRVVLEQRVERRAASFNAQLPSTLQLIAGSLQAGHGLLQAIDTVTKEAGPPASLEFSRVLAEARLGMPLEDALSAMAGRVGSEDFRWVVLAINIQQQVGGNLSALLENVAGTLRKRAQLHRQVKVLSAEGRLSAWILALLPFGVAGYMLLVNPSYLGPLVESALGRAMIVAGLLGMGVGAIWLRKIVRIKA